MIKSLPIGYIELQRGWAGDITADQLRDIIKEVRATVARDYPGMVQHGARVEATTDGAGVAHQTLYMGFAPRRQTTPPLDPTNLNDAPPPQIGHALPDLPLGAKERKF